MRKTKVIVNPYDHTENDYIKLQIRCIEQAGMEPVPQKGNRCAANFIVYNWYENMDCKGGALLIRKLLMLNYYRFFRKKIIWVMHNKHPHEAEDRYSLFIMKYLSKISNAIMILSDETVKSLQKINPDPQIMKKVYKVPLISYESLVGTIEPKHCTDELSLLMFGRIQPYKCIELLIEAVNGSKYRDKLKIKIVGSSKDEKYVYKLKKIIDDNQNIDLDPRFISLEELKEYASRADAFALPMDTDSALNSSAVMMAFSLARTVICPEIGTTKEIKNAKDFIYTYDYKNKQEHLLQLRKTIEHAYEERATLEKKGLLARENIRKHNSIKSVSLHFKEMFEDCK